MLHFTYVQDVKLFHDKFGLETPASFTQLSDDLHKFRTGFFVEELTEYVDAVEDGDLATTLDSLIDLVYIIAGAALLHGIEHDEFYAASLIVNEFFSSDAVLEEGLVRDVKPISLPAPIVVECFSTLMQAHIDCYNEVHESKDLTLYDRREYVKYILAAMFNSCLTASGYCGCTEELWQDLWNDVQRANMSKERALKATDSKRGSTYDVIKPEGWLPPQTDAIIARHRELL